MRGMPSYCVPKLQMGEIDFATQSQGSTGSHLDGDSRVCWAALDHCGWNILDAKGGHTDAQSNARPGLQTCVVQVHKP